MSPEDLAALDHAHLWHPFTPQRRWESSEPLIIESSEGNILIDIHGARYIDGVSSLWTNVHGHRHPRIDEAIRKQLDHVAHSTMLGLTHPPAIRLAHRLVNVAPWGLERVFYSDNGSTAVEVALKMAYQHAQQSGETQRTRFACLADAYHGDTLGAVSVGAIDLFHQVYRPLIFDTVTLPAPTHPASSEEDACLERSLALLDEHGAELVALVVEPLVQGAAGMKMHSKRFLSALIEKAREHGVLVIADEVAVGFGRLGTLFAMEQVGHSPDFLCLAKGLAAGYLPLAATLTTQSVYNSFLAAPEAYKQFFHGHTFTGNPLACAAALASLDLFEETEVIQRVGRLEAQLRYLLEDRFTQHPAVATVRHKGVMVGIDLQDPSGGPLSAAQQAGHRVAMACRRHGAIIRPLSDTIVLNPPLSITDAELTQLVDATRRAIDEVL